MKTHLSMIIGLSVLCLLGACSQEKQVEWVSTTENSSWEAQANIQIQNEAGSDFDAEIFPDKPLQQISGFGACFNELGWTSLSFLPETERNDIFEELFRPGKGANFTVCRMPVGANDFSLDWYSYNETDGDFDMNNFSITSDEKTLAPFILQAKKYNPELTLWASPWSPPSWMKYNRHYACRPDSRVNDLEGDPHTNLEGSNMFIQEAEYLKAYALYFGKFIDAYAEKGIRMDAVAPQNEFNSCQNFPSCTWTASALTEFVGQYLGPEMEKRQVKIIFGTMERPDWKMVDTALTDPLAKKYITAAGFQWAGKKAIGDVHRNYPDLPLYQTEQECGNGKNDWTGAVHSWELMEHYLSNGASVYDYWNISLAKGGISHWGWAQNSLIVVDTTARSFAYTPEYYAMKHYSHYVLPGAQRLETSAYDHLLAFRNTDGSIVIAIGNFEEQDKTLKIKVNGQTIHPNLKANSFNTFLIK
jgi:glucosylceramidase